MKKLLITLFIFGLIFTLPSSFAQEKATESAKVEYNLPYHGMLPDNPLYTLKAFRDRLIATLISDPLKKAEFNLLSSDKRLSASVALYERGKKDLSESTISKGLNYFEDGLKNLELAKKQGREIGGLLTNYELSIEKHLEVLENLKKGLNGSLLSKFNSLEKRAKNYEKRVLEFKSSLNQ